jgi:glycosyltransferase involved in cell wall biosynthesis
MQISFVIPAYNEQDYIGKTIEHILKQPEGLVKEIIVADNGSTDQTSEVAKKYPKVKVVVETRKGTNWARQAGLNAATGDVVAFIDADNWVPPNWSETAMKYLQKPGVVAVSGPMIYREQGWLARFITFNVFLLIAYPIYWVVHYILKRGGVVLGGNIAAKREALLRIGGLDTSFTFFGDDANTGRRLRKIGKVLFTHRLTVSASSRRFKKHGYFKTTSRYFLNFLWVILFNKPFTR